ncbi:FAD binding domain-containing protein [Streptomyces sp. NPDC007251]|uniref:FAD binding domain-containing protein n=1 Tax=unclassified Streptomyces TaxID=2593676 RepID=UPI003411301C
MDFLRPATWADALDAKARRPDATPVAGGTDVMTEINMDLRRPTALLDLTRIDELAEWSEAGGRLRIGAGVPYSRIIRELGTRLPGLAMASRTVGSPQIRNRGTLGGNLGTASPAGDALPPLVASGADVEVASVRGSRMIPAGAFFTGVKRNALAEDELIAAVHVPPAAGPQQFAKVGSRNAMVIAVCSFALSLDLGHRTVGACVGSAAPTPRRAAEAERFLAAELADSGRWEDPAPLPEPVLRTFGDLVASAAAPIDDVRSTAAYRRHALAVLARRTLGWAWNEHCGGRRTCA